MFFYSFIPNISSIEFFCSLSFMFEFILSFFVNVILILVFLFTFVLASIDWFVHILFVTLLFT